MDDVIDETNISDQLADATGQSDRLLIRGSTFYGAESVCAENGESSVVEAGIVTPGATATELEIAGVTYRGEAFESIGSALGKNSVVAAEECIIHDVTTVGQGKTVVIADSAIQVTSYILYAGLINDDGVAHLTDCIVTGNSGSHYGAIRNSGGVMTVNGSTINDNSSESGGGGVYQYFGSLYISGSTFGGNRARLNGGAIHSASATLTVEDSVFSNNEGFCGGAIWSFNNVAAISGCTFVCNSASTHGGAICADGLTKLTVENCEFSSNTAGDGGALYVDTNATVTVSGCTFDGNNSLNTSGAIYSKGTLTITDSSFLATGDDIHSWGTLSLNGDIWCAGQLYAEREISIAEDTELTIDVSAQVGATTVNTGTQSIVKPYIRNYDTAFAQQDNVSISIKVSNDLPEDLYYIADTASTFNKTLTVICGEESATLGIGESAVLGGRTYGIAKFNGDYIGLTVGDNVIPSAIIALRKTDALTIRGERYKGAFYYWQYLKDAIAANQTIAVQGWDELFTVRHISIDDDKLFVGDRIITYDQASTASGGAVMVESGTVSFTESVFTGNTAAVSGGAIYGGTGTRIDLVGCTFSGNTAETGGAVYNSGTAAIADCAFTTETDTICSTGDVTLAGTITLAASVISSDGGRYSCSEGLTLDFINTTSISVAALTGAENIRSLSFRGGACVAFSSLSLTDASISIDCELPLNGQPLIIASGISSLGTGAITINGRATTDDLVWLNSKLYKVSLVVGNLILEEQKNAIDAGIVTPDMAGNTVIDGVGYHGMAFEFIDKVFGSRLTYSKAAVKGCSFSIRSTIERGNSAVIDSTLFHDHMSTDLGGVLFINGGSASISGSTFSNNLGDQPGSAIFVNSGSASITGSTFSGNSSSKSGGAIYIANRGNVKLSDSIFATATDTLYNAGEATLAGTISLAADVITADEGHYFCSGDLVLDFINTTSISIGALSNAGNIKELYFHGTQTVHFSNLSLTNIVINIDCALPDVGETITLATGLASQGAESVIVHGTAVSYGGAFVDGRAYAMSFSDGNLTIRCGGDAPEAAIVTATPVDGIAVNGSGYAAGTWYYPNDIQDALDTCNVVASQGCTYSSMNGPIAVGNNKSFAANGIVFADNGLVINNAAAIEAAAFSTVTLVDGTFASNSSYYHSAITAGTSSTFTLIGGMFDHNASIYDSGAIFEDVGAKLDASGVSFIGNAGRDGGAIYLDKNALASISDSTFSGNTAVNCGGAIDANGAAVSISNVIFSNNTTGNYGGAIDANGAAVSISGGTFHENTSGNHGGAMHVATGSTTTITDGLFRRNKAQNNGGAIDAESTSMVEISSGTFFANTANKGAAVYAESNVDLDVTGGTFMSNHASRDGGAIYNGGTLTVSDAIFYDNVAGDSGGGAIYNTGTATISGATFSSNAANRYGGAIYCYQNGVMTLDAGCLFSGNKAKYGGAIAVDASAEITVSGGTFCSNSADTTGGAIYNGGTLTVSDTIFTANSAGTGGAIYNAGTLTIRNSAFMSRGDIVHNAGVATLEGSITLAANLSGNAYACSVSGVELTFENSSDISVAQLTNVANLRNLTFRGGRVSFSNLALFDTDITIECKLPDAYPLTVAEGLSDLGSGTITVNGRTVKDGKVFIDGAFYSVVLNSNDLKLEKQANVNAGIVTPGGTAAGETNINGVKYEGKGYQYLNDALDENPLAAVSGCVFVGSTGCHTDVGYKKMVVIDHSTISNAYITDQWRGAALDLGERAVAEITDCVFSSNRSYSGGSAISAGTFSVLSVSRCIFSASTGCGAIHSLLGATTTVRDSTFSNNIVSSASPYGGAIYLASREGRFTAENCVFEGATATYGAGIFIADHYIECTIIGSTFSNNVNFDIKDSNHKEGTIRVAGISNVTIAGCVFDGNTGGAVRVANGYTTISDSTFATEKDSIFFNQNATVYFSGSISLASDVTAYAPDQHGGTVTCLRGTNLVFTNTTSISIWRLSFEENIERLAFEGTDVVNFNNLDAHTATIDIDCVLPDSGQVTVVAKGIASLGSGSISVHGQKVVDDLVRLDGDMYRLSLSDSNLQLSHLDSIEAGIVTPDGRQFALVSGTCYAGESFGSIEEAHENSSLVVVQGCTFTTQSVISSGRTLIDQTEFKGSSVTVEEETGGAISFKGNSATIQITESTFTGNWAVSGGAVAIHNNSATAAIDNDIFADNSAIKGGAVYNDSGTISITGNVFTGNTATQESGGAIHNQGAITISGSTFSGNSAEKDGGAIYNQGAITISGSTFSGNLTKGHGGAIYMNGGVATVRDSVFMTRTDTIYVFSGTMTIGGTIWTAANINSTKAISVEKNTKLVLDISSYRGVLENELITNFGMIFGGMQNDLTISIAVGPDQLNGDYLLATGIGTLAQTDFSIVTADSPTGVTLEVNGQAQIYGGKKYQLYHSEDLHKLQLAVGEATYTDAGIITPDGAHQVDIDDVTYFGRSFDSIDNALDEYTTAVAQGGSFSSLATIAAGRMALIDAALFSAAPTNPDGAILNSGTAVLQDSTFATSRDTVSNSGIMTFGGTIRSAANISSANAITVKPETKLVLDLSVYNGTTAKELLSDYGTIFGTTQADLTISIDVAADQARGTYVLATGAADFDTGKVISVTSNGTAIGSFNLAAGTTAFNLGEDRYLLKLSDDGELLLKIEGKLGVVTADGQADTVVIGGTTYTGDRYSQDQIATAMSDKMTVAAQNAALSRVTVDSDRMFIGDGVSMSSLSSTNGGAISSSGTATLSDSAFTGNSAEYGGAIYSSGTVAISGGTFTGNSTEYGGAISLSNVVNAVISGSTFSDNTANENSGAIDVRGSILTVADSVFSGNTAGSYGGAMGIFGGSTVTVSNSQFLTSTDSIFVDADSRLILEGTVILAGQLASGNSVTVECGTDLRMCISGHDADETGAFLADYSVSFADDDNLSLSVAADPQQARGRYLLVDGLPGDFDKAITVYCGTAPTGVALEIGDTADINGIRYSLVREDDSLYMTIQNFRVAILVPDADGGMRTITCDGQTYTGTTYDDSNITAGTSWASEAAVIVAQGYSDGAPSFDFDDSYIVDGQQVIIDNCRYADGNSISCNGKGVSLYLKDSVFQNYSGTGDAVLSATSGNNTIVKDCLFENNKGAIYGDSDLELSGCTFSGNGGALHTSGGTVNISQAVFTGNSANAGGAVYNCNSDLTITDSTFDGNSAVENGGALYNDSNRSLTIENCSFVTRTDTVYSLGGAFTLGGTIVTAAEVYSANAIVFKDGTQIILDISDYSGTELADGLLLNYNAAFAPMEEGVAISVRSRLLKQENGSYVLASGLGEAGFNASIAVTASDPAHKLFDIAVGDTMQYSGKTYALAIEGDKLTLNVSGSFDTVYVNNAWANLDDGTPVVVPGGTAVIGINAVGALSDARGLAPEKIEFVGGSYSAVLFGGGENGDVAEAAASTSLAFQDGTFAKSVIAGNKIQTEEMLQTLSVDSMLSVQGGSYSAYVMGGDHLSTAQKDVAMINITGSRTLNISGGVFQGKIVGGSYLAGGAATLFSQFNGDINVTISGGTFENRIYGGDITDKMQNSTTDIINGNIAFTLDASENDIQINENIVCGSYAYGTIKGDLVFTVKGDDGNLHFGDDSVINGGSGNGYLKLANGKTVKEYDNFVNGTSTAVFDGFQGDFTARLTLFDAISFSEGADVSLTNAKCNLAELSAWQFADGAGVTFSDQQTNDFSGDILEIDLTGWSGEEDWTLATGNTGAFNGFDKFESVFLGNTKATYAEGCYTAGDFTLSLSQDNKSMVLAMTK